MIKIGKGDHKEGRGSPDSEGEPLASHSYDYIKDNKSFINFQRCVTIKSMRAQDHIITSVALSADLGITLFWFQKGEVPKQLVDVAKNVTAFLTTPTGGFSLPLFVVISVFLFFLGTILPDIDHPNSMVGKHVYLPVKHRTWTHAIYLPVIFFVTGVFYKPMFYLGWGMLCHCIFDAFSSTGICWLYPLKRKHHLTLYHTGEMSEYVVAILFVIISVMYGFFALQQVYHFVDVRWTV